MQDQLSLPSGSLILISVCKMIYGRTIYAEFHASVLSGEQKSEYLIYDCAVMGNFCGGFGNRLHAITVIFMFALLTKRVFLLRMTHPVDINTYLLPDAIQ